MGLMWLHENGIYNIHLTPQSLQFVNTSDCFFSLLNSLGQRWNQNYNVWTSKSFTLPCIQIPSFALSWLLAWRLWDQQNTRFHEHSVFRFSLVENDIFALGSMLYFFWTGCYPRKAYDDIYSEVGGVLATNDPVRLICTSKIFTFSHWRLFGASNLLPTSMKRWRLLWRYACIQWDECYSFSDLLGTRKQTTENWRFSQTNSGYLFPPSRLVSLISRI